MKEVDKLHSKHQHVDWTPGSRLRQVRERAGFSQEQIAKHLHLRLSIIEAIENDQYDQIKELVFIRGYLRAYANLLNLPADEIIHAFNQLESSRKEAGASSPAVQRNHTIPVYQRNHRSSSLRWIIYSVVLILVIVVLWYY